MWDRGSDHFYLHLLGSFRVLVSALLLLRPTHSHVCLVCTWESKARILSAEACFSPSALSLFPHLLSPQLVKRMHQSFTHVLSSPVTLGRRSHSERLLTCLDSAAVSNR